MANLKLKVAKTKRYNPVTKTLGYAARVVTNGKAGYEDIVGEACHNTTLHKAEAKMTFELCMESVAALLKQGYIVDLGPVGTLYPSCNSGWSATEDGLSLDSVRPSLYYRPTDDVQGSVRAATLTWARADEAAADDTTTPDDGTPADTTGNGSGSGTGNQQAGDEEP